MEEPRLQIGAVLKAYMGYRKFAGDLPRMLVLRGDYWLDHACVNAARRLGWDCRETPVPMVGAISRTALADIIQILVDFRPDFVLTINMGGFDAAGLLAGLFFDLKIPLASWFVDDPRTILMESKAFASDYAVALTWEPAYAGYLRDRGFALVEHLPLGVDDTVFNGAPRDAFTLPPTFVGNSMTAFSEREWAWIQERPALAGRITRGFERQQVARDRFALGFEAMFGPDTEEATDAETRRHAEMFAFIEGTRRLRVEMVQALEPFGLHVRGDEAWPRYVDAGRCGPYVNYHVDMPHFYADCEMSLNTTSLQMATTVNQRVFDCPAAGGFLLTDIQPGLVELFEPDVEIACYASMAECVDKYRFYHSRPAARKTVVDRGRARALACHTYVHRLQALAAWLRSRYR